MPGRKNIIAMGMIFLPALAMMGIKFLLPIGILLTTTYFFPKITNLVNKQKETGYVYIFLFLSSIGYILFGPIILSLKNENISELIPFLPAYIPMLLVAAIGFYHLRLYSYEPPEEGHQ